MKIRKIILSRKEMERGSELIILQRGYKGQINFDNCLIYN